MHKEQIVGYIGNKAYWFHCDPNGKYNPHGTIMSGAGSRLHMKYPEQAWLLLGIASVFLSNGKEEERCCEPYIQLHRKCSCDNCHMEQGGARWDSLSKDLKDGGHSWAQNFQHTNDQWEEELVGMVKGVGWAKQQQLANMQGITKVGEIKHATRDKIQEILSNPSNSFTLTSMLKIQENVQCAEPGDVPHTIYVDCRKANNPYESCYGDNWKETIKEGPKSKQPYVLQN